MANPQHIKWLREGVDSWNARRKSIDLVPDLESADIHNDFLKLSYLNETRRIDLRGVNLNGAVLRGANLRGVDFQGADLRGADLRGAHLQGADLITADLRRVNIKSEIRQGGKRFVGFSQFTDLSSVRTLHQTQLNNMIGDTGVILPAGLEYPAHWPDWRDEGTNRKLEIPDKQSAGDHIALHDGKYALTHATPPQRNELERLYNDLKNDAENLKKAGNLGNVSALFDGSLQKYIDLTTPEYDDLDQIMLGVKGAQLQLIYESEKEIIAEVASEKNGYIEAMLLAHGLLANRLPEWTAFLGETNEDEQVTKENAQNLSKEFKKVTEDTAENPRIFEPEIPEALLEYLKTSTTKALLAARNLIGNIMHAAYSEAKSLSKDGYKRARPAIVLGISTVILGAVGAVGLELASIFPEAFGWIKNGFEFVKSAAETAKSLLK